MTNVIQNLLKDQGYEIIAVPKPDLTPLKLLLKENKHLSEYGGSMLDLFEPDVAGLPVIQTGTPDINGSKALKAETSVGLELLSGLMAALQLSNSEVGASFASGKDTSLSFSFQNIKEEKVETISLDNFLMGAIPKKEGFERSLERLKNSELYVTTSVLKSNAFFIEVNASNEQAGNVKAGIEKIVSASGQFERAGDNSFSIKPSGGQYFAFAYRAARIIFDRKRWFEFWQEDEKFQIRSDKGLVLRSPEDFPVVVLQTDDGISRF